MRIFKSCESWFRQMKNFDYIKMKHEGSMQVYKKFPE